MPEIKRAFSSSKMNKDVDERLVPKGEYRDAKNIEVNTSEGSNVGTVQTVLGNTALTSIFPTDSFCVGSIADEKNDKIYWLVAGASETTNNVTITKDYIVEYNVQNASYKYVVVDIYEVKIKAEGASTAANGFLYAPEISSVDSYNNIGIRLDMVVTADNATIGDNYIVTDIQTDTNKWKILTSTGFATSDDEDVTFTAERVLNFDKSRLITGINILDGMLFWTDDHSEPKKINIERCIAGTGGTQYLQGGSVSGYASTTTTTTNLIFTGDTDTFHTRLVSSIDGFTLEVMTDRLKQKAVWLEEEHVAVLKKSPHTPPYLEMSSTDASRTNSSGTAYNISTTLTDFAFASTISGTSALLSVDGAIYPDSNVPGLTFDTDVDFRVGDVIILTNNTDANPTNFTEHEVRIRIEEVPTTTDLANDIVSSGIYSWSLLSINTTLATSQQNWLARLEQSKPLFEFKFPRFAYRYKYKDGEYSSFSPFSEIAFLPSDFDYAPKQGYNLGMTNQLRSLKITDYVVEDAARGRDVVEVDILFKNEDSPNIYTVKSIKISDGHPVWPDKSITGQEKARGRFEIESELIHATVPSNQLLRPWDNVPIKAKAQEITANRLVYGNYVQNYDIKDFAGEEIIPNINVSLESIAGDLANGVIDATPTPSKSVKSLRTYQVGVIYRDRYGRETPVLPGNAVDSVVKVEKDECTKFNKLKAKITSSPPIWANSWKFFVKETSNEYYNLAQDRWYNAEDGNIWLSFPSAERNKVDEDTYLILKKQHDGDAAVTEKARYKAIAIENEAPEFIKTNTKVLGQMAATDNWLTSTIAGFPFIDYESFLVQNGVGIFYESFGGVKDSSGNYTSLNPKIMEALHSGYLWIRINSATDTGVWYNVANIKEAVFGNIEIQIDGKFGEDMTFAAPLQTTASIISGLVLEMATRIPENKPEFDGKFFVKIYKDLVLKENILNKTAKSDYVVLSSISPYYITYDSFDGGTNDLINSLDSSGYLLTTTFNILPKSATAAEVNAFISWGGTPAIKRNAKNWWRAFGVGWFIDSACTANEGHAEVGGISSGIVSDSSIADGEHGIYDATATNNTAGIVGANKIITISFSGIFPQGETIETPDNMAGPLSGPNQPTETFAVGTANVHPGQKENVDLMNTVGTQFRFRDDPDKHIYTIKATTTSGGLYNYDADDGIVDSFPNCANKRRRWRLTVENENGNGIGIDGEGYRPDQDDTSGAASWTGANSTRSRVMEFVEPFNADDEQFSSRNPGIWETEPKEDVGMDIYYEATQAYPISIDYKTNEQFAKYGSTVQNEGHDPALGGSATSGSAFTSTVTLSSWSDRTATISSSQTIYEGDVISFTSPDGGVTRLVASGDTTGQAVAFNNTPHEQVVTLPFSNCYSFGNGVESNRIRDDYNEIFIKNGVKASTVLAEHYEQERRGSGLIHSGIYNSTSGINNLNQFVQAEPITKDLNPRYGSIQKLHNRDTNLITICEDKVFGILADKDALFNADGSAQLVASKKVLGQTTPYAGNYGTLNPESFAADSFRSYFVDRIRGSVLRLSQNGVIPISSQGMHDWFGDNLKAKTWDADSDGTDDQKITISKIVGSFDTKKAQYNVSITQKLDAIKGVSFESYDDVEYTVSYSENAKGWVSFKTFYPESGLSMNNDYYTWKDGELYKHHENSTRNNFYGVQYDSDVTVMLNDQPESVKSFNTLNYEGSQSKVTQYTSTSPSDGEYYNLNAKTGWYVSSITTDQQTGAVPEFKDKEGKWFNYIRGETTTLSNLDQKEFSVQGIGVATTVSGSGETNTHTFTIANNTSTTYGTPDWDSTAD